MALGAIVRAIVSSHLWLTETSSHLYAIYCENHWHFLKNKQTSLRLQTSVFHLEQDFTAMDLIHPCVF